MKNIQNDHFQNSIPRIDHYIVGGTPWYRDGILFRRNRLAEYLLHHEKTSGVYSILSSGIRLKHPLKDLKLLNERTGYIPNGVFQIALPDNRGHVRYGKIFGKYINKRVLKYINKNTIRFLWFTNPSYAGLCELPVWDKLIYDCSDYWNRPPSRPDKIKSEKRIISRSDYIFATSQFLVDNIKSISGKNAVLIENGVDFEMFTGSAPWELKGIPRPRFGFVGGLKSKIDYELLIYFAKKDPRVSIVLIGPLVDKNNEKLNELTVLPNVYSIDTVKTKDVPSYMKSLDVGLLPYKKIDYNLGVSPLKLFEYLAAEIPAVGTGLPSTEKFSSEGVYYYTNNGYEDFAEKCLEALQNKDDLKYRDRRLETAAIHDWNKKFQYMLDIVMSDTFAGKEHCTGNTVTSIRSITY